jgi:hypothetical protein
MKIDQVMAKKYPNSDPWPRNLNYLEKQLKGISSLSETDFVPLWFMCPAKEVMIIKIILRERQIYGYAGR